MLILRIFILASILIAGSGLLSCKKYLDLKPDKKLVVPSTLEDLQALIDQQLIMNSIQSVSLGEGSADNYYISAPDWEALANEGERNVYIWGDEIIFNSFKNCWSALYDRVYYCNIILENIEKIKRTAANAEQWDNIKGSAYFLRAKSFFMTAVLWCKAYDPVSGGTDLGIPLRLNSDFNEPSVRASVNETYNQIVSDLKSSVSLLVNTPGHVMRPSKPAAYALLSRTFLAMRVYDKAGLYADSCIQLKNTLLDYNPPVNPAASFPFALFNSEVLFHSVGALSLLNISRAKIDSLLYQSYDTNDLRKTVYFRNNNNGSFGFKGGYTGGSPQFVGLTVSEVYLTKAECLARSGSIDEAMSMLNLLLAKRWKLGTFSGLSASSAEQALTIILAERRKELIMRDTRWMDIKRLNKEPGREIIIRRVLNNQTYELPPNDPRYALPIPAYVIEMTGIQQNPR